MLVLFDYDLADRAQDSFMASGALRLPFSTTVTATLDRRSKPMRKQQKSYVEQTMSLTDGWDLSLPVDRITYFTQELSEDVTTLTVGLTYRFFNVLQLSGSAAQLAIDDDGNSAISDEYFYHLQFSGDNFIINGNRNTLDLSHRITGPTRTSTASIDTRYAINRYWNLSSRLRTDSSNNVQDRSVKWVAAPSVSLQYRWRDLFGMKIEAGGEWLKQEFDNREDSESSYFIKLGYSANF